MQVGVNQWCFPKGQPVGQMLAAAAAAGFEAFEPAVALEGEGDVLQGGLHLGSTEADCRRLAARARELGLAIATLAQGLGWSYPLTSPDPAVRARARDIHRRVLELAAALGARVALVVPGVVTPEVPYDEAYARALEEVARLAEVAAGLQVRIGIENVWNRFLLSPLEMAQFVDAVGSPWVGAYLDVGNVLAVGYPEHWLRILGQRVVAVHVKDYNPAVGTVHGFTHLLAGAVNWPAVRRELERIGYDGPVTAELAPYPHFPLQHLRDTARHIRVIIRGADDADPAWGGRTHP